LFGNAKDRFQDELSSRPERSVAEGSAVRPSGFPNSGAKVQSSHADSLAPALFFYWWNLVQIYDDRG
jgi:hypothetical protein